MKQVLTLVCKLNPTPDQIAKIEATLKAFADACNYTNERVKPQITNKTTIQNIVYEDLRSKFGLAANLAVRACARVGANRKTAKVKSKPVKQFKPTSADYDARIFSFWEEDWAVSLTTVDGRERIKLNAGNYQRGKLKGQKPTSAQLCKHRDGQYYIHVQIKDDAPTPRSSNNVIGIDFGRTDIAVTSNGDKWDGKQLTKTRDRYARTRASLQRKASTRTRSTRRRARQILVRLSGRERRFQTWLNHNISKFIILSALTNKCLVAIEDLTGIRERTNTQPRTKEERRRSNSWSFFQLRTFLEYKGLQSGVEVIAISPRYTSRTCHKCLHIHPDPDKSYRSGKRFKCGHCGWKGDADENGSQVIRIVGAAHVNPLGGSILSCSLLDHVRATESPRYTACG
ncbi:MAG: transposase [Chroococcidiopsidaceae cyanobacterium CP_BM_RX_35]|nr:transposase [Chroococcidiopsidaceae cyanobacterium CP_BM_RX_35]